MSVVWLLKMMSSSQQPQQQEFTHCLKLEETAKGVRISVHVYANSEEQVIQEAFNTYLKAKITAIDNKIPLAPVEIKQ
jgi:hypothetical protein